MDPLRLTSVSRSSSSSVSTSDLVVKEEAPHRKHAMMRDFEHSSLEEFESMPPKELS